MNTTSELLLGPLVGGLSPTGAHLWGRSTGPGQLHAWIGSQPDLSDARPAGTSLPLSAENAYAGVAPVHALNPSTHYHYSLALSPDPPDPNQGPYPAFRTLPRDGESAPFSFAFGSCFRPATSGGGGIFRTINARRQADDLRFILMIGDQIYADDHAHNSLGKIATTLDDYRSVYSYTWSRQPLRELLAELPAFLTMDDHEVDDDWTWTDSSRTRAQIPIWDQVIRWLQGRPKEERRIPRQRVQDALQAYWEHQGMHTPHLISPPSITPAGQYVLDPADPGSLAFTFTCGAAAFFVMDTRTRRVRGRGERTILGKGQWEALESWLLQMKDAYPVKFLVSSSAVIFDMWIDFARDRWNGFPVERDRLLHFLAANGIEGVYLLTGDLHSAHAVRIELYGPQGNALPVWEFCASPFEQEPNRWARATYRPLRSGPVRDQQLYFVQEQLNFGVIRVDYPEDVPARVRFRLYSENGELLGSAGS